MPRGCCACAACRLQVVLDAISLDKDVDGFHPTNIGSLAMRGRQPLFVSCTPKVRVSVCMWGGRG
jgi:5,10-methylene-tetrahydrofolate dehydrogenase/methenyl tetrahydrofolate cyclohydrolase